MKSDAKDAWVIGISGFILFSIAGALRITQGTLPLFGDSWGLLSPFTSIHAPLSTAILRTLEGIPLSWLIGPFLGAVAVVLLWMLLQEHPREERFLAVGFAALSPALLTPYSSFQGIAVGLCLLLGFALTMRHKQLMIAAVLALFLGIESSSMATIALVGVLLAMFISHLSLKQAWPILCSAVGVIYFTPTFFHTMPLTRMISEFGGLTGVGIITLTVAVLAIPSAWKRSIRWPLICLLALVLPSAETIAIAAIGIAVLAAMFAAQVLREHWESPMLRTLTLLLIICGALFTAVAELREYSSIPPSAGDINALQYLRLHTPVDMVVLTADPYLIEAIAERKTIAVDARITQVLDTSAPKLIKEKLADMGVSAVYYTPGAFPFPANEETFKNVYRDAGVEIWVLP